ncbi:MAG: hypothetical protein EPN97_17195 [Alphaproteobacteria bacterium]|nr:MAG: hypothetical protein EPN97_17195 [Alphaproteobacteria bacterium]
MTSLENTVAAAVQNPHDAAAVTAALTTAAFFAFLIVAAIVFTVVVKSAGKDVEKGKSGAPPGEKP